MRIRKNTTLSSLLSAAGCGGEKTQTHVCHLNQSPWDVIPFTSSVDAAAAVLTNQLDSPWFLPSSSSCSHQFDGDDSFNGNVSLGDSYGAAESVVSVEKLGIIAEDNDEKSSDEEHSDRSDWKSSSNKAKKSKSKSHEPNSSQKTSGAKSGDQPNPASGTAVSPPRRGRPRGTGKKASASATTTTNPYEFYYYSGFGPRWGKRRDGGKSGAEEEKLVCNGDRDGNKKNGDCRNNGNDDNSNVDRRVLGDEDGKTTTFGGEYNWEEEDDVVDQEGKVMTMMMMKKKKRGRKPVKARSLRSLV